MEAFRIFTYHGFGDHCICYGIIKEFAKIYEKIECYSDRTFSGVYDIRTFNSAKRLYSTLKNVELMPEPYVEETHCAHHSIAGTPYWFEKVGGWIKDTSLPPPDWFDESWIFDRQWYFNACLPFNFKWDNFYFERNLIKEKEVFYDVLGLKDNEEFIFLHEDPARKYYIKREYINPNIKLIEFDKLLDINILDILYTVEKAKEVHTYNTSTLTFIDLMNINHNNINYHKYVRPWIFEQPGLHLNWKIIDK